MNAKERLLMYLEKQGITKAEFERRAGLSNGYVNNFKGNFGADKLERILFNYPDLSKVWLLTGEGEMLANDNVSEAGASIDALPIYTVPMLPISAQGGTFNDFVISVKDSDCERIISPIRGVDFAMPVSGDSMAPEYPSGSQILIKRINEKAFIDWGKVYVLDTCNGSVIKKLYPSDNPEKLICKSINPEYPPFEVSFEDVYGVYRVLMCMSVK